jgi:lipopolysaccharide/colanic/teichoic acid biosynthesis glycosyltransferase
MSQVLAEIGEQLMPEDEIATASCGRSYQCSNREFFRETTFRNVLAWEKRRSERSGNSFLLALVHLDGSKGNRRKDQATEAVIQSLCAVVRDTDAVGWYKSREILGVAFTDLKESERTVARNSIDRKLKQALQATLPAERAEDIRVTYHIFPESDAVSGSGDPIFYADCAPVAPPTAARILKRSMDVMGSLLALLVLSPLMLLIALAVKLTSEGPVCCRQKRIGQGGRRFTFLKFRSMFHNSDPSLHRNYVTRMIAGQNVAQVHRAEVGIYKIVNDPRITPIGRLLRRSSLDELPQFFNVLKGDMSLVGPRPPLPYEFECYSAWHRRRVLEVKPGLTGLWQVYGRGRTNFDEMVRLDLRYARQWSLWLDLKLLLKTPIIVILGAGAY